MLLVDRAAVAIPPQPAEVAAWAAGIRVFISSVMRDMSDERRAAASAVRALGGEPVMFETFGGRDSDPEEAYLSEVASSHIYVGILGTSYGRLLRTRRSATHEEYREAERQALRVSVWTDSAEKWSGDQQSLVDEIRLFHVTGSYCDPADLRAGLEERLRQIAAEDLCPWVKIGKAFDDGVIVRAREIHDEGRNVEIVTSVRDPEIIAWLEDLRGGLLNSWSGSVTWEGHSLRTRARGVSVSRRSTMTADLTLRFERDTASGSTGEPFPQMVYRMATSTLTPDDVTEAALRYTLFGEDHPFGSTMAFLARIDNPVELARQLSVSEEALRPILRVLFTEALVGSKRATRLAGVKLGVPIEGRRALKVLWAPLPHSGSAVGLRSVSGTVSL